MIQVDGSINGAEDALGTASGILDGVSSNIFKDDVVRMFYSYMALEFGQHADRAARVMPSQYEHMYDWGMLGLKSGRLWNDQLSGGVGRRFATFTFRPSTRPVPKTTPQNTGIRQSMFPNLSDRKYVFVNKAMVFETGMTTTITPKNNDRLFVPLRHKTRTGWRDVDYGGNLTPYDIKRGFVWAERVQQSHENTAGNFTTLYQIFYATQNERVFAESVKPRLERPIRKVYLANMPNLGGSTYVSRAKRAGAVRFNPRAVVAKRHKVAGELRTQIRAEASKVEMEDEWDG